MTNAAQIARAQYEATMATLRSTVPNGSREFAWLAADACAAYEAAMVADIGTTRANKLGANHERLA